MIATMFPNSAPNKLSLLLAILLVFTASIYVSSQAPGGVSSGLQAWFKADAGTSSTVNGAFLSAWNDQSPNGVHATQSTGTAQPQYFVNMINGNPAVRTTSARFMNFSLAGISSSNHTIFTVSRRQAGGSFQNVIGIKETGANEGLCLGYAGSSLIRFIQYNNWVNVACPSFNGSTEIPTILSCQFDQAVGKRAWYIRDGAQTISNNSNRTFTPHTATARIGRGNNDFGFTGLISEVIVYNRILTAAEKMQIHTYLSVKYGLSVPGSEHLYYNDAAYGNDVFGIGRDVAGQGLNQTTSNSVGLDDILELRSPTAMDDGDYLVCGNNNGTTTFSAYSGSNCAITSIMGRKWKARKQNDPGNVTLRFDLTGITGYNSSNLRLLIDDEGDGFDDEVGIGGVFTAPYFDIVNIDIPHGAIFTIGEYRSAWYAVASGNASGAVWATSIGGTPQVLTSFCAFSHLVVNTGVTINNDWVTLSCKNFELMPGSVWNASSGSVTATGDMIINGTLNAQSSTMILSGTFAQNIQGSGISNVYNLTINNAFGVRIDPSSAGVRARNIVNVVNGQFVTNNLLTLVSDVGSTGMIAALTAGSVAGNVTVQRYHNAQAQGWVNLSCPIQNKTINDWNDDLITTGFAGSDYPPPYSFNNVQYYNEPTAGGMNAGYLGVNNVTNPIVQGRGYFVFMNNGVMNLDVDGAINSGNITLPVTYTSTGNPSGDGWNLVGNPYPCTIDWNSLSWTKTNINNAVYVWNAAIGQYASYVGGVGTNGGSRYIPSSQSFFVVANGAGANLVLTENCKSTNQGVFKNNTVEGTLILHLANDNYSDETTLSRNEQGTLQYDRDFDAYKLRSPLTEVPYMATISDDGADLSVNSFGVFTSETIVPLRIEAGVTGDYQLTCTGLNSFSNGACIILEDLLTGNTYALNQQDGITLHLEAGNTELRFQLRIGAGGLTSVTTAGCPGMEHGSAMVFVSETYPSDITWVDASGEVLATQTGVTGYQGIQNLASGLYTVEIGSNDQCGVRSVSFYVDEDEAIIANAVLAPVSCADADDGAIALNIMGGVSPYDVIWSNGMSSGNIENLEKGDHTAFVTDQRGCAAAFTFTIPVASRLTSSFETLHDSYELMNGAVEVAFFNTSENATNSEWTFGDASLTTADANPVHLFNRRGLYEVVLKTGDGECETTSKKMIAITRPLSEGEQFGSEMMGVLTDEGVRIMFFFDKPRRIQINGYNVLGQQLIAPINGVYERQTITFSDRKYAANALIEVTDMDTGERTLMRMGL